MPLRDPDDKRAFADMLATVGALYSREVSKSLTAMYWQALLPYDLAAVRAAFDRHVKNPDAGQYMPKPADLIRMIAGGTADAALLAWAKVERAIRTVGGHESLVFDDPLIHRAIEQMGGWVKLCETLEKDLPFRAQEFATIYRGYALRREIPAYPAMLVGRFNAQRVQQRFALLPPVLVGSREDCERVHRHGVAGGGLVPITRAADPLLLAHEQG